MKTTNCGVGFATFEDYRDTVDHIIMSSVVTNQTKESQVNNGELKFVGSL